MGFRLAHGGQKVIDGMNNSSEQTKNHIWMFWAQGWDQAPDVAHCARLSWEENNPDWHLRALDAQTALDVFGADIPETLQRQDLPIEAYSDVLRIELLARFGGVWCDATTICAKPLMQWLSANAVDRGFFAFSRPGPDRMIASWFLYAVQDGYMITGLRDAVRAYWSHRQTRDDYFWLHNLFEQQTISDPEFHRLWQQPPHIPARHLFHFAPNAPRLGQPPTDNDYAVLATEKWPVFKLTHKHTITEPKGTLFDVLKNYRPR